MIPFAGLAAGAGKLVSKAVDLIKAADKTSDTINTGKKAVNFGNKGTSEVVEKIAKNLDEGTKAIKNSIEGSTSAKYKVGAYKDIKGIEGLDAHHVGQKATMKKLVIGYDPMTAPAINVPKVGHTIKGDNGIVSRSTKGNK